MAEASFDADQTIASSCFGRGTHGNMPQKSDGTTQERQIDGLTTKDLIFIKPSHRPHPDTDPRHEREVCKMPRRAHSHSGPRVAVMPAPANDFTCILTAPEYRAGIDFNRAAMLVRFDGTQAAVIGASFVHLLSWDRPGIASHDPG